MIVFKLGRGRIARRWSIEKKELFPVTPNLQTDLARSCTLQSYTSVVPRRSLLGQSWTLSLAVTSPRDTRLVIHLWAEREEKSRHFATSPLVSRRNDVWGTSAEIPHWWRVTTQIWVVQWLVKMCFIQSEAHVISMEFLRSFLRRHFAGKPVVASPNVSCFLRLTSTGWYEGQARYYSLTWDVTFAAFLTLSIHESWMPSVAAKSSASPIWTPIMFISETTTCMIAKDELTMKSVILKTINNDDDDDDDTLYFAGAGKQWFSVVKKELVPRLSQLGLHSLQTVEEKLSTFEITTSFHKFRIYIFIGKYSKSRRFIVIADDFLVLLRTSYLF